MNETGQLAVKITALVFQLGVIFLTVRLCGKLAGKLKFSVRLAEFLAGIIIGPSALGGLPLPGFPKGIFPETLLLGGINFRETGIPEADTGLRILAAIAVVILFFASGLGTNIILFLRYSIAGSLVGLGGALVSFIFGALSGTVLLGSRFNSPECLLLGLIAVVTSTGVSARVLSDNKKMNSPEGVTALAAAVFDNIAGIIGFLAFIMVSSVKNGGETGPDAGALAGATIKIFGICILVIILGRIFSKKIAGFLRVFTDSPENSIVALGAALLLAGIFGKQGLPFIIGAYMAGLALSKTDIAPRIQERLSGLYDFFIPVLFALLGMMIDTGELFSPWSLSFAAIYTLGTLAAKIIGAGGPALILGFNIKGAMRIGTGMFPRGELAIVIAATGLGLGILDQRLYTGIALAVTASAVGVVPLAAIFLKSGGKGSWRQVKGDDSSAASWDFSSGESAGLVTSMFLGSLRKAGFYVRMMNRDRGLSQARKETIALSITKHEKSLTVETAGVDMPFIKNAVHKTIADIGESFGKFRETSDPRADKPWAGAEQLSLISPDCISINLKGETKEGIITELADLLVKKQRILNRDAVLRDLFAREKIMSTGMQNGIALPHAKTDGVTSLTTALGIKKEGVNFESLDGQKSRIFIMTLSPRNTSGPHVQFLSAISAFLKDENLREDLLQCASAEEAAAILRKK